MADDLGAGGDLDLVDSLVQLSFAVQEVLARAAARCGLSMTQLRLLGILRDRTPPMTAIANHLGLDRSSVTGLIDRAERRGLVNRTVSADDGRVTLVGVTAAGLELVLRALSLVTDELTALVDPVPEAGRACIVEVATSILAARSVRMLTDADRRSETGDRGGRTVTGAGER
jgi:DNA-binding MarR family transcriptional regulator